MFPPSCLMLAPILGVFFNGVILAHAAYDLWAASLVYFILIGFSSVVVYQANSLETNSGLHVVPLWPLPVFCVVGLISGHYSANRAEAVLRLMEIGAAMVMFFIAMNMFRQRETISRFVRIASGVIFIQFPLHVTQTLQQGLADKPFGTLINANVSAIFHLLWIPVLWSEARSSRMARAAVVVAFINLLLTRSTVGIICALAAIPFMVGWPHILGFWRSNRRLVNFIVGLQILLVLVLVGFKVYEMASGHVFGLDSVKYTSRMIWWRSGINMFLDHPWIGIGPGNFTSSYLAYKVGDGFHTLYAHSFLVTLLAETGVLGTLAALGFFIVWILCWRRVPDRAKTWPFVVSVFLAVVFGMVNIGFEYLGILLTLATFMGMAIANMPVKRWVPSRLHVWVFMALGLSSLPYVIAPFMASQRIALGLEAIKQKSFDEAIQLYTAASELNPLASEAYFGLAEAYYRKGRNSNSLELVQKAIDSLRQAIDRNRRSGFLWFRLGAYLSFLGQQEEAAKAWENSIRLNYHHSTSTHDEE